jgi:hypothetical protein
VLMTIRLSLAASAVDFSLGILRALASWRIEVVTLLGRYPSVALLANCLVSDWLALCFDQFR